MNICDAKWPSFVYYYFKMPYNVFDGHTDNGNLMATNFNMNAAIFG